MWATQGRLQRSAPWIVSSNIPGHTPHKDININSVPNVVQQDSFSWRYTIRREKSRSEPPVQETWTLTVGKVKMQAPLRRNQLKQLHGWHLNPISAKHWELGRNKHNFKHSVYLTRQYEKPEVPQDVTFLNTLNVLANVVRKEKQTGFKTSLKVFIGLERWIRG